MTEDHWKSGVILLAALGQTLFVILYATFPWYRTFLGRALFFKAFTLTLLVDTAVMRIVWDWPNEAVAIVIYGLVSLGIWAQLIAFLREKRVNQKEYSTVETVTKHRGEIA